MTHVAVMMWCPERIRSSTMIVGVHIADAKLDVKTYSGFSHASGPEE